MRELDRAQGAGAESTSDDEWVAAAEDEAAALEDARDAGAGALAFGDASLWEGFEPQVHIQRSVQLLKAADRL